MQEIYLIEASSGSYDDYYTRIIKAFSNQNDAEQYIQKYNDDLKLKKNSLQKCDGCPIHWGLDEEDEEYKEWKDTLEQKCKDYCERADILLKGKDFFTCKNEIDSFVEEKHEVRIMTIAIE